MKLKAILLLSWKEEQRKKNGQEIDKAGKKIVKDAKH